MEKLYGLLTITCLILVTVFTGCGGGGHKDKNPVTGSPAAVYVAGYYSDGFGPVPCYWTGRTRIDLPNEGYGGETSSIYIADGTVYTAGYYYDGAKEVLCYWAGSARTALTGVGSYNARVLSIFVYNGTVYSSGYYYNGSKQIPCYWMGTAKTCDLDLTDVTFSDAKANSIYVADGAVHISGNYDDSIRHISIPCYWTGTIGTSGTSRIDLPGDGTNTAYANSICVADGTVYIAGNYNNGNIFNACYWTYTSGTATSRVGLRTVAIANSIYVSGGTVYTAGYYGNGTKQIPCYWAGTTEADIAKTDLPGGGGSYYEQARSVFVKDGMVYTTGGYGNGTKQIPCYWRDAEKVDLQDGVAMAIFVP